MKSAALKLDVEIGVDRIIRLPEGVPVGRVEVILLFEERAAASSVRPESPRPPPLRSEPSMKLQSPKLEPIKPEPPRVEPIKSEPPRVESIKSEPPRAEATNSDASKADVPATIPPPPMTKRSPKSPPPLPSHFPPVKSPLGDRLAATRPRGK